jgi:hypothetical protein
LERRRKRRLHRRRRTRREHLGELVQMDGSHHDWFEGRRGWANWCRWTVRITTGSRGDAAGRC